MSEIKLELNPALPLEAEPRCLNALCEGVEGPEDTRCPQCQIVAFCAGDNCGAEVSSKAAARIADDALLLSVPQACAVLGIRETKLFQLAKDGVLKRVKIGRKTTFSRGSVLDLVEYGTSL